MFHCKPDETQYIYSRILRFCANPDNQPFVTVSGVLGAKSWMLSQVEKSVTLSSHWFFQVLFNTLLHQCFSSSFHYNHMLQLELLDLNQ